jgi:hypothetical protein
MRQGDAMAITAPLSKYKKQTYLIWMAILIGFGVYCVYDGYFSDNFKAKHSDAEGNPDSTLVFNQKAPPYLIGAAVVIGIYFFAVSGRKIVAEDNELIINDKEKIAYDSIEKIDKTNFKSKGYFVITYKDSSGREISRKISGRMYDNLEAVLNEVVSKIS